MERQIVWTPDQTYQSQCLEFLRFFPFFFLQRLESMLLVVKVTLTAVPLGLFVHVMTRFLQEAVHMEPADVLIPTPTRMASV